MTYEEFLAWADEDILAEWVDGVVEVTNPAGTRHQQIVIFLLTVMNLHITHHRLGEIMIAPYQMRLRQPPRGRSPDLFFVAQGNVDKFTEYYFYGPADLVVEVISPESFSRDRGEKFYEYEMSGVQEYWLIDPERKQVEFYQLDDLGHYRLALGGDSGEYQSLVVSGLTVDVSWLWQEPLPVVW